MCADLATCLQVLSPFIDPVTKSKAEFVSTADYEVSKAGKDTSSSTWSSWFSSSSSKASSKQQQAQAQQASARAQSDSDSVDADLDVVVEEDQGSSKTHKGPGTFGPLLPFYKTAFCLERHTALLRTAGVA